MNHSLPDPLDTAAIVDHHEMVFDAGDTQNGSLYVCLALGSAAAHPVIDALRGAGLWSDDAPKQVSEDQRPAYRDGLRYVDAAVFADGEQAFLLARFDHPKFPSDSTRWGEWLACVGALYERQR